MGVGIPGILLHGACQPDGVPRERRTILPLRTQDNSGSGDADNLYCGGYVSLSRRETALESRMRIPLPYGSRGIHVSATQQLEIWNLEFGKF